MKQQVFNPYLPPWEYIPDGEPHIFDSRLYIYGSHDRFDGEYFCLNDYVCWSAPLDDLSQWRFDGTIYKKDRDPHNPNGEHYLFAPDVIKGPDGRYYLYYSLDNTGILSVAVCETPDGKYEYLGDVHRKDGVPLGESTEDIYPFDPGAFMDDDGRVFVYVGFAPPDGRVIRGKTGFKGAYCVELETDMLTIRTEPKLILPKVGHSEGTGFEGHEFFEASSMRKINNVYYLIYSSINSHELCYATSRYPDRDFIFGGTIISNGDVFYKGRIEPLNYTANTHGGLVEVNGQWYIFYHRQTNRHVFSRQGCAEKVYFAEDGSIPQVEMTSCGLNPAPLSGKGEYGAYIACNLFGTDGAGGYSGEKSLFKDHPAFTQDEPDGEMGNGAYINNITDGTIVGFKYFDFSATTGISLELRGTGNGQMIVKNDLEGDEVGRIDVNAGRDYSMFEGKIDFQNGIKALYLIFEGAGSLDFRKFILT